MADCSLDLSGRPLVATRIDEQLFVDRERELRRIVASVHRRSNVLVLGERGAGKTSVLHRVNSELRDDGDVAVLVDATPVEDLEGLVELIRWRLRGAAELPAPHALLPQGSAPRSIELVQSLAPQGNARHRIVLLLDNIRAPDVAHALFGRLRDEVWKLPYIWVVAADSNQRTAYLRPPADAFFGTVVELEPLSSEAAVDLLNRRLAREVDEDVIEQIAKTAGGNPRRLLGLARAVVLDDRPADAVVADRVQRDAELSRLGGFARRVVEYIEENGRVSASDPTFLEELGWTRPRATQVLNGLARQGLLVARTDKGGRRKYFELPEVA